MARLPPWRVAGRELSKYNAKGTVDRTSYKPTIRISILDHTKALTTGPRR